MHSKGRTPSHMFGMTLRPENALVAIMIVFLFLIFMFLFLALTGQSAQGQSFNVIYNFSLGRGPALPWAGLTMDSAGNFYGTTLHGGVQNTNCPYGCGTVFKLSNSASGWTVTVLHVFNGSDGAFPAARVVFGPDGSLYGTTVQGGSGGGTVFRLSPPASPCVTTMCNWTPTVLYRFPCSDGDGCGPGYGDLTFDRAGNIYGTTSEGGINCYEDYPYGCGVVYELTPSYGAWTESILHRFAGGSDGIWPYAGVILDQAGNLYGTTCFGGANYAGVVYELTPSGYGWTETTLYTFQGQDDGDAPYGGVIFDSRGNLYGTTSHGGGSYGDDGTVFELSPAYGGWTFNLLYVFGGYGGPEASLIMDAAGNLYGTEVFGSGGGTAFKLTSSSRGWTYTSLHDFGSSDGIYLYGNVILDAGGNVYGTAFDDGGYGFGTVWEITP